MLRAICGARVRMYVFRSSRVGGGDGEDEWEFSTFDSPTFGRSGFGPCAVYWLGCSPFIFDSSWSDSALTGRSIV